MGSIIWILYGVEIINSPLIITHTIGAIIIAIVIIGWVKYGRDKTISKNKK